jgi:hypothetical protein
MSAITAMANEKPITVVLRASSMRAVTICMPLVKMKAETKKSTAPMTGTGIATNAAPATGTTDSTANVAPAAKPTLRLVMPVAPASPMPAL